MSFELDKYEHAVGAMRAAQIALQLFIKDTANELHERQYAETIYEWLGSLEATIDELMEISIDKTSFILRALEKYSLNTILYDSNTILNYIYAIDSLRYQTKICVSKSIDALNKLEKIEEIEKIEKIEEIEEIEQRTYNGVYYADAMDMEAAIKEHAKQQKRNNML